MVSLYYCDDTAKYFIVFQQLQSLGLKHALIQQVISERGSNNSDTENVYFLSLVVFVLVFFNCNEGKEMGSASARHRNAIYIAFRWRADDGLTLNSYLVAL